MEYTPEIYEAFLDELQKIAAANPFKGGQLGMFQRFGHDLMAGGKMLGSKKLVAPGQFAQANLGQRVAGDVAHSVGHHYANKSTFSNLINPLGGALGGTAEGLTRSAGRELHSAGANVAGRTGRAMQTTGSGLQRAAKPMGRVGEVAGLATLGGAVHAPVSLAGLVGHHMAGGAAAAAPAVGEAIHSLGAAGAHAAHDVIGTATHGFADKARRAAGLVRKPVAAPVTGYSMMPPPMAAGAA